MITDIIGALIIGLIVGAIARFLLPGRDPMGCLATSLLGIGGAFVGGFLSRLFFPQPSPNQYLRPGFLASLVGAILLLLLVRMLRRP
ncbi:MAG TPA: GlsB/YeaQ/YmgE family stress response membrane protein [Acidobacteriota bacterium]|nr:GlsB/YeaQ/YmgE family stress response membrane protein [Acidobacteriota bacterium]